MHLWDQIPSNWKNHLQSQKQNLDLISRELSNRLEHGGHIAPRVQDIFRALECDINQVNVIIVGQDPYPNPAHATGLAFSVPLGTNPLPPTLRNILKEVSQDIGESACEQGDLSSWVSQGVLLLNRVLTIEAGVSTSHHNLGWHGVTEAIVQASVAVNPDVVAVLWGRQAQELVTLFDQTRTIATAHPSPLSAYRGFFGSRPFSRVNQLLVAQGKAPIQW